MLLIVIIFAWSYGLSREMIWIWTTWRDMNMDYLEKRYGVCARKLSGKIKSNDKYRH